MYNVSMLSVTRLSSERNDRILFSDLNFTIKPGHGLHVVGPNGAGKTTLLRIVSGLLPATEGTIQKQGDLLYIGHQPGLKAHLSPLENLKFMLALTNLQAKMSIEQALNQLGLKGLEHVPTHTLSAGQQRRVSLARLLLVPAKLWILDEPFTSLDRTGIKFIEQLLIEHLRQQGLLLLTSHQPLKVQGIFMHQLILDA